MKRCALTIALYLVFIITATGQQKKNYSFNSQGSPCYFQYILYAPGGDLESQKRPFIFVLGTAGSSAEEAFHTDTLKYHPDFFNYLFVYLPASGGKPAERLGCVDALSSAITMNYQFGRENLFLQVYDTTIRRNDLRTDGVNMLFKKVRLASEVQSDSVAVASEFRENENAYVTQVAEDEEEEYYDEYSDSTAASPEPVRVYNGPAQQFNFTLTGIVRDKKNGEALPFATIRIAGTTLGTTSNTEGHFTLLKVPSDTSTLIVQYIGYDKGTVFLTPFTPKRNLVVELRPTAQSIQTVVIRGVRGDVMLAGENSVGTISLTPKKLEELPNIGEKDIMRSLQLMPGVSAANESSSGLYVRGGTPDQNLVLFDGFTVYHVDHLYGFFSAFNANALKDVQLHKGGFESRFGGRLSSVTEITGKEGNSKRFNLGGDLSLLSMNFFAEVPVGKKFTSIVAFRRSYKGPLYNKIFDSFNKSDDETDAPAGGPMMQQAQASSYFYDLNGKFTFRPNDRDALTLSIFTGTDKLDNSISSPSFGGLGSGSSFSMNTTDLTKYGNIGGSLKWARRWSDKLYGTTIASYSNYFSDRDRSSERTLVNSSGESTTSNEGIFENNDLRDYSLKSDYQWDLFNFSQLQFGGFASYYDIKYTYAQNDTNTILDRADKAFLGGAYLQAQLRFFHNRLKITPGVRSSYFQTTGQLYYEPRASLIFNLTDQISLKGAAGRYYQFANRVTREDILSGSRDFWLLSDGENVPVSSAIHWIGGFSWENDVLLFSTEAYYKKLDGLTEYSLRINASPFNVDYNENFFTGYGYARGIEFLLQKKSGRFNGWVSYTLGEAMNHFTAYSDAYFPANQDVTHEFKAVTLYKYKRWNFSATWVFATGRPYTAPSGAYTITLLDDSEQEFFTVTDKNALRLPDYHRADISASYKLLAGSARRREIGSIGFSVFNLYNRKNVWYKTYSIADGEIIETNVNYMGITPNLTLSLKIR